MRPSRPRGHRLRNELIAGLAAIVLASALATYAVVVAGSRRNFDALVEKNDVEIAASFAASFADFYRLTRSWEGVAAAVAGLKQDPHPLSAGADTRRAPGRHPKDDDLPLVLLDASGAAVYSGIKPKEAGREEAAPPKLKLSDGQPVIVDGTPVGYVYFKSMLARGYDPKEKAYMESLTRSIGVSVLTGLILAFGLGAFFASRFAGPVAALDRAVQTLADGDLGARVRVRRRDEVGSLAENFNRMADRLQAAETARQNLLADIAHELRTPVSIIQANLEMIIDGVYQADDARLRSLYEETRILTGLISDLRSLSDLEVGAATARPQRVSLGELAEESCRKLMPMFEEKRMRLERPREGEGFEAWAFADPDQLRQVMRNILNNALAHASPGSTVRVELSAVPAGPGARAAARLTIADEGPGVPEADLGRIFERFYRVDQSRNRESGGRGLGLAICRRIVESFEGRIGACNREPHGLAVWFELPLAD